MAVRQSRFAKILTWATIPLIMFGSLPRLGCICADGNHKTFCQRHLQPPQSGGCVCCERRTAAASASATEKPAAGTPRPTCCQRQLGKLNLGRPELTTGRPCKSVVVQPLLLAAAKLSSDLDRVDLAPLFVAADPLPAGVPCIVAESVHAGAVPPPDRVTTLGVLLI